MKSFEEVKYGGGNPLRTRLLENFVSTVKRWLSSESGFVLDIGCGEGHLARLVLEDRPGIHLDIDHASLLRARTRRPTGRFVRGSIYALPFRSGIDNTAVCLEVLEHLEHPADAVAELRRVAGRRLIVSVPHEPWFSLSCLASGKYLTRLGRHPGHVNYWTASGARELLARTFRVARQALPFPWSLFECEPR
jgi:ubiquinone/menaquinone biosynthesis C-methylase UbiE